MIDNTNIKINCLNTLSVDISLHNFVQLSSNLRELIEPCSVATITHFKRYRKTEDEHQLLKMLTETPLHKQAQVPFDPLAFKLNRYSDIVPLKHSAVLLGKPDDEFCKRYINANYIFDPFTGRERTFIATQAPLPLGFENFWKLVEEEQVSLIVNLCAPKIDGKPGCDIYWPEADRPLLFQDNQSLEVALVKETDSRDGFYKTREFRVLNRTTGHARAVEQIHIVGWPDKQVPKPETLPMLYKLIDYLISLKHQAPFLVHCSAGVGRAGTTISLFYLRWLFLSHWERIKEEGVSIFGLVRNLKEQRTGMVQTSEQYLLLYTAMASWIQNKISG
jgi:protein tyrosine phosphatase